MTSLDEHSPDADPTTATAATAAAADADAAARAEPEWVEHAIWWHVYPLSFAGAPATADDDHPGDTDAFGRLTGWLDYAVELGVSGILLSPIFASETHGYDTVDYTRIDPRLGDEADFADFVAQAKARGLRIALDGVFNHVGRGFDLFQRALSGGAQSAEAEWFRIVGTGETGEPVYANFEGHDALVALNHAHPPVADLVAETMVHWLDRGIDGWRLDVAYAMPTRFWAEVLGRVRSSHPDAFVFGEVIHGDYTAIVSEATLDSLTQYELWKAVGNSIEQANLFELAHALERHTGFAERFSPVTFIGNHDVTRIASTITDERHHPHALVVLFTVAGTPVVYYGDEQGFRGIKEERIGGDDAIRPEFPSDGPSSLAPEGWPVYHLHQQLIGLRRRHPWLHRASSTTLTLTNTEFVYESRSREAGERGGRIVVALSVGDSPLLIGDEFAGLDVVAGEFGDDGSVPPHGWVVLADTA